MIAPEPGRLDGAYGLAIDKHFVLGRDLHRGRIELLAIEFDPTFRDQPLGVAARTHARARQEFGDAFAFQARKRLGIGWWSFGHVRGDLSLARDSRT